MPEPTTAIAGASIAISAYSIYSANKADKDADTAEKESLEFQKNRYEDWKNVYGGVEQNLSEYYNTLSPEYYTALGLESAQQGYQTEMERLNTSLVQRGISLDSGIAASLKQQSGINLAESKAQVRRDAPRVVAQDKQNFLSIGYGVNPAESLANTMGNQAAAKRQEAISAAQAAGQSVSNTVQTVGSALQGYSRGDSSGGGE